MNDVNELLTSHLDIWTDAVEKKPGASRGNGGAVNFYGIKKLRELILELAMRGNLTPQSPTEESVETLFDTIETQRSALIQARAIRTPKPAQPIKDTLFKVPQNWKWGRLGELCSFENGDRSKNYPNKSVLVSEGLPFVNAGHLQNGLISMEEMSFISQERYDLLKSGKFVDGDILFCLRGSLGKFGRLYT